jgi:glycosyltransferase involved in cell wall biosynthesis
MAQITAIIPCFNEEHTIAKAIQSVAWADQILLLDSFSTDRSVEIAQSLGAEVIQRNYEYSASQKNWAIPQAKYDWIILLDADERIPAKLQSEIQKKIENPGKELAFWIPRKNRFMGKQVHFGDWKRDAVIRLFKRDACRYQDLRVHAEIIADGPIGRLNNFLEHDTYKGLQHYLHKIERYTNWGAHDRFEKGKRAGWFHFILKPWWSFTRAYLLRLGFLDGKVGFVLAYLAAYTAFVRSVKLWRLQNGEEIPKD